MKAVILAAGRGKRMGSLTDERPKPLLKFKDKELIKHTLDLIPRAASEIIIIVGYYGDLIRAAVGAMWNDIPVVYIDEPDLKGTGYALWKARERLAGETFLVFPADDIYAATDVAALIAAGSSILAAHVASGTVSGGKVVTGSAGEIISITEGTHVAPAHVNAAVYHLDHRFFDYPLVLIPGRTEYGLPQTLALYAKDVPVRIVEASAWKQVVGPDDLK